MSFLTSPNPKEPSVSGADASPAQPPAPQVSAASPSPYSSSAAAGRQHAFEQVRRYQSAFEAIVLALTQFEIDKAVAEEAKRIAEAEEKARKEEEEARLAAEKEAAEKTAAESNAEEAEGEEGKPVREASPAPAAPAATTAEDKPSRSLFGALGGPSASPANNTTAKDAPSVAPPDPNAYIHTASKAIVKGLKELFEGCSNVKDAAKSAPYAPWTAKLLLEHPAILEDHNVALFAACFVNSACTYAGQIDTVLDGDVLFEFTMAIAKIHRRQKKLIHVAFSGIVNLCHVPKLSPMSVHPQQLIEYLAPLHAEAPVVEAWCMGVTNLCLRFPMLVRSFCDNKAVVMLERLLLLFGDDPKILSRGLALLNILTQHTVMIE